MKIKPSEKSKNPAVIYNSAHSHITPSFLLSPLLPYLITPLDTFSGAANNELVCLFELSFVLERFPYTEKRKKIT